MTISLLSLTQNSTLQVEFFSQPLRRYVPALLVGLAVEATSPRPRSVVKDPGTEWN